jgi:hypothetical protein
MVHTKESFNSNEIAFGYVMLSQWSQEALLLGKRALAIGGKFRASN